MNCPVGVQRITALKFGENCPHVYDISNKTVVQQQLTEFLLNTEMFMKT